MTTTTKPSRIDDAWSKVLVRGFCLSLCSDVVKREKYTKLHRRLPRHVDAAEARRQYEYLRHDSEPFGPWLEALHYAIELECGGTRPDYYAFGNSDDDGPQYDDIRDLVSEHLRKNAIGRGRDERYRIGDSVHFVRGFECEIKADLLIEVPPGTTAESLGMPDRDQFDARVEVGSDDDRGIEIELAFNIERYGGRTYVRAEAQT